MLRCFEVGMLGCWEVGRMVGMVSWSDWLGWSVGWYGCLIWDAGDHKGRPYRGRGGGGAGNMKPDFSVGRRAASLRVTARGGEDWWRVG